MLIKIVAKGSVVLVKADNTLTEKKYIIITTSDISMPLR